MTRTALALAALLSLPLPALAAPGDIATIAGSPGTGDPLTLQQTPWAIFVRGTDVYSADAGPSVVRVLHTTTPADPIQAAR